MKHVKETQLSFQPSNTDSRKLEYLDKRCRHLVVIVRSWKPPFYNLFEDVNKTNNQVLVRIWILQNQVIEGTQGCTHDPRIIITEPLRTISTTTQKSIKLSMQQFKKVKRLAHMKKKCIFISVHTFVENWNMYVK
jgi:hypothetical protein